MHFHSWLKRCVSFWNLRMLWSRYLVSGPCPDPSTRGARTAHVVVKHCASMHPTEIALERNQRDANMPHLVMLTPRCLRREYTGRYAARAESRGEDGRCETSTNCRYLRSLIAPSSFDPSASSSRVRAAKDVADRCELQTYMVIPFPSKSIHQEIGRASISMR